MIQNQIYQLVYSLTSLQSWIWTRMAGVGNAVKPFPTFSSAEMGGQLTIKHGADSDPQCSNKWPVNVHQVVPRSLRTAPFSDCTHWCIIEGGSVWKIRWTSNSQKSCSPVFFSHPNTLNFPGIPSNSEVLRPSRRNRAKSCIWSHLQSRSLSRAQEVCGPRSTPLQVKAHSQPAHTGRVPTLQDDGADGAQLGCQSV